MGVGARAIVCVCVMSVLSLGKRLLARMERRAGWEAMLSAQWETEVALLRRQAIHIRTSRVIVLAKSCEVIVGRWQGLKDRASRRKMGCSRPRGAGMKETSLLLVLLLAGPLHEMTRLVASLQRQQDVEGEDA